ncbi:hypothetical protein L596_025419 [Steinernema carpocapsae]|uniref:Uncharacterized protein n=1 Tax=Steinernema carpocapsae TaxID=34508 RepID=A0A4U5M7Q7_STECR|nr:hypothetical protein L596_025419 [Steinernema carpocapsae]
MAVAKYECAPLIIDILTSVSCSGQDLKKSLEAKKANKANSKESNKLRMSVVDTRNSVVGSAFTRRTGSPGSPEGSTPLGGLL